MTDEVLPISALSFDPANPRLRTERSAHVIRSSLQRYGPLRSLVGQKLPDGRIVIRAGNGTLEEAGQVGIEKVRLIQRRADELVVVVADDLDEEKWVQYSVDDNRASDLSTWDPAILEQISQDIDLSNSFLEGELDELIESLAGLTEGLGEDELFEGETDPDDVPDFDEVETRVKKGDIWRLGRHRVRCGDSTVITDVERLMDGKKADMVFTDPPYGVAYVGGTKDALTIENDDVSPEKLKELVREWFSCADAVTKDGAYMLATVPAGPLHLIFAQDWLDRGWLRQIMVWNKSQMVLGHSEYHYKHEPILFGWKPGDRLKNTDRTKTTVWDFNKPSASRIHPTMKPVEMWEYGISQHTLRGGVLYEPFLGSGTTLIAAEKTGRTCYGMELSEKYCDVILKRWEDFTGQTAERI